jgi:dolichol kinase
MYSQLGLLMTLFFILFAVSFIILSIFQEFRLSKLLNKNSKLAKRLKKEHENESLKCIFFCYLFVILLFTFPFIVSIYKGEITEAVFVFLMAIIFFILYLKEIKSIKRLK